MVAFRTVDAEIISIGTELLTGQTVDTNAAWLSLGLTRLGVRVVRHVTVSDEADRIEAAIRAAIGTANLIVVTGGLGPTLDDMTRGALAAAIGQPLEENAEAMEQIRALFTRLQRPMSESNKVQAMIPRSCAVLRNHRGSAPGIGFRRDDVELFALPGVPAEMRDMFSRAVAPVVRSRCLEVCTRCSRLLCFGRSEAALGELLADLMQPGRNPAVGTTSSRGVISIRLVANERDEAAARRLVAADAGEIRRLLGLAVFGEDEDTMQAVVARLLFKRKETIAVAESCTGGLLGKRLTDVPGSSAYFLRGCVAYSNEAKSDLLSVQPELIVAEGAVSEPVARAMAANCRAAAKADFALSITGIAGPGGGCPPQRPVGLVYIGLADPDRVDVRRILLGEHLSRDEIRDRACTSALNLLRLRLLGAVEASLKAH